MGTDPGSEQHRQPDGEHRGRCGNLHMPEPGGTRHVPVRLPQRTAEPPSQLPRGVRRWHPPVQQVHRGVDPLGQHVTTSTRPSTVGRTTTRHVTNVLLDMSHPLGAVSYTHLRAHETDSYLV